MKTYICPSCSGTKSQSFWIWEREPFLARAGVSPAKVSFRICQTCGLIFQAPKLPAERVEWLHRNLDCFDVIGEEQHRERFDWLERHAEEKMEAGAMLEVGCADGSFLPYFLERGWEAIGSDVSDTAQKAKERGLPILCEPIEECDFGGRTFDLIAFYHLFEHIGEPVPFLQKIHALLKSDGAVCLEVPYPLTYPRYRHCCLPAFHYCEYTIPTLRYILRRTGFLIRHAETFGAVRVLLSKSDPQPDADPAEYVRPDWYLVCMQKFRRNAFLAKTLEILYELNQQKPPDASAIKKTFTQWDREGQYRIALRDILGNLMLFENQIREKLQQSKDRWPVVLSFTLDYLRADYQLFDALLFGGLSAINDRSQMHRFSCCGKMVGEMTPDSLADRYDREEFQYILANIEESLTRCKKRILVLLE